MYGCATESARMELQWNKHAIRVSKKQKKKAAEKVLE